MDSSDLELRLAFLSLGKEDLALLRNLRPAFEEHADRVVSHFYRHLLSFEPTRRLLRDPDVKERLLEKQRNYLVSLAGDTIDPKYGDDRLQIGETHERVGLDPEWYLGAYSLYFSLLVPLILEYHGSDPVRSERAVGALMKRLMLDAQLAMKAYIQTREHQLEYLTRELEAESRSLAREVETAGHELRETTQRVRAAEELASTATLVAGLAHEIGTPMSVIHGHAELLEQAVSDPEARERLGIIRRQIDRISNIIRTLLNVARPSEPSFAPVQLADILDRTLTFLGDKLRARKITVERDVLPLPEIRADAARLEQLFLNLLVNAVDAMREGGTLTVSARPKGRRQVEVRVRDTGRGIRGDELDRIFEPFFTTKAAGEGSGLGLVVARGIVSDHGGEIEASSEPGQGTEFRIRLPIT